MVAAARLVQVVVEVGAGRNQTVDVTVRDQVGDDQAQPRCTERARQPEEDRNVILEHPLPQAVRGAEISSLERDPLHP